MTSLTVLQSLGYNGFFIEGASFAIVYAVLLQDPAWTNTENMAALHTAVECLEDLMVGWPFRTTCDALRRMIVLLEGLHAPSKGAQNPGA